MSHPYFSDGVVVPKFWKGREEGGTESGEWARGKWTSVLSRKISPPVLLHSQPQLQTPQKKKKKKKCIHKELHCIHAIHVFLISDAPLHFYILLFIFEVEDVSHTFQTSMAPKNNILFREGSNACVCERLLSKFSFSPFFVF